MKFSLICSTLLLGLVTAFPEGPPVDLFSNLCVHMDPSAIAGGHGTTAQTVEPPFEIVTSQKCYKEQSSLEVRIRITDPNWYFEGYLMMARSGTDNTAAYGTFDIGSMDYSKEFSCFGVDKSAVGHTAKFHYWVRTFTWHAPDADKGPLHFQATLVKNKITYWMDVKSDVLTYDANCGSSTLPEDEYPDFQVELNTTTTAAPTPVVAATSLTSASFIITSLTCLLALVVCRK